MDILKSDAFKIKSAMLVWLFSSIAFADVYIDMSNDSQRVITIPANQSTTINYLGFNRTINSCEIKGNIAISDLKGQSHFYLELKGSDNHIINFDDSIPLSKLLSATFSNTTSSEIQLEHNCVARALPAFR